MRWGANSYGQLGDGTKTNRNIPTPIDLGSDIHATQIELGSYHTCAITNENKVMCWGRNNLGQLGDGTWTDRSTPTAIDLGLNVLAQQISLGSAKSQASSCRGMLQCSATVLAEA